MKENNIKPDNFTYSTIIKGLNKNSNNTKENELELAFKLFDNVKKNSKPDEILYNCIMDACLRFGKIEKMLEIYDTMQFEGVKKDYFPFEGHYISCDMYAIVSEDYFKQIE